MARPTVRTISRYLLRQHCAPLGFALAALTSLMLLNQIAKQFGSLVGKGLPWSVIAEVFLLSVPFIVAVTIPMAVLVAVLHVFTRLAADNEITALQAGGVSVGRVIALALKEQVINEVVAGRFFLRAARIDGSSNKLKDVTIYDLADAERRRIITADSGRMAYSGGGRDLYLTLQDGDIEELSRADPTQFNRTFFSTNRMRVAGVANTFQPTTTDTYKSDREMSTCEMQEAVESARRDVESATGDARLVVDNDLRRLAGLAPLPPRALAAAGGDLKLPSPYCRALRRLAAWLLPAEAGAQTPRPAQRPTPPHPGPRPLAPSAGRAAPFTPPYVAAGLITPGAGTGEEQRLRAARERAAAYEVEIQKKYAIALACLVFALVGAPIALRFQRGGVGLVLGVSVAVFTVYYIGLIGGEELGDRLIVSPFFAMWTPNLIFAAVGLAMLWVVRRETSTAH